MPRRFTGLSGGSRVPLRGFTQLLKNLSGPERDRISSAFADAENMIDFHNTTVPQRQLKRRISGLIDAPILSTTGSVLGASVRWDRLDDPRITFYEIQIDNTNIFANPEVFEALDTFFTLENVSTVKFVRVRGVRQDGQAGNFSATARIQPTITAPTAVSHEFYQGYRGSDPDLTRRVIYGGPGFYELFKQKFYVDREVGSLSAWGYISNRLKDDRDSNLRPWDRLRFKINGITRLDQYFPLWTDTFNDLANFPQVVSGVPMSFYMKGGYTAAFGPFDTDIPSTLAGQGPNDAQTFRDAEADTPSDSFYWQNPVRAHNQMKWEQGQLTSVTDLDTSQETFFLGLPGGRKTGFLTAQDFRFNFEPTDKITGVEVLVKRRQILPPQDIIEVDEGPALPNYPLDNIIGVTNDSISEDAIFGRHITEPDAIGDRLQVASTSTAGDGSIGFEDVNSVSASVWLLNQDGDGNENDSGTVRIFKIDGVSPANRNSFEIMLVDIGGSERFQVRARDKDGNLTTYQSPTNQTNPITSTPNAWNNVVATFDGRGSTAAALFLNGQGITMTLSSGGTFTGFDDTIDRYIDIIAGDSNSTTYLGSRGQVGLWNAILDQPDAFAIHAAFGTADLRADFGNYDKSNKLLHYWLRLGGESDIRDFEVFLIDENGTILTETANRAVTTESWPLLDTYSTLDQSDPIDGTAVPSASGIPHDNMTGIGYQSYGGEADTWGFYNPSTLTASIVNSANFGVAFRARNETDSFAGSGLVDHIKMVVYKLKKGKDRNNVVLSVDAGAHNEFYVERQVLAGLFNALEIGPKLAPDLSDC